MTKSERMTNSNDETGACAAENFSPFGLRISFVIGHSLFVLWPLRFSVPMHGRMAERAFHEPTRSGTGVSPVRTRRPTHGRDAAATSLRAGPKAGAPGCVPSIQQTPGQTVVGIDASVAQERPMRARDID